MKKINLDEICNSDQVPFFLGLFGKPNNCIEPLSSINSNTGFYNRNLVLNILSGYLNSNDIQTILVSPNEISSKTYNQLLENNTSRINSYFERIADSKEINKNNYLSLFEKIGFSVASISSRNPQKFYSETTNDITKKKIIKELKIIQKDVMSIKPLHLSEELSTMEYVINCYKNSIPEKTQKDKKPLLYLIKNE